MNYTTLNLVGRDHLKVILSCLIKLGETKITEFKSLRGSLVFMVALSAVIGQAQPAFMTNGLVAYYPFDGNAIDESGSGNNGSLRGGATFTSDRFGSPNSAILLNSLGDHVLIPKSASLDVVPGNGFSVSAWVRPPSSNPNSPAVVAWGNWETVLGPNLGVNEQVYGKILWKVGYTSKFPFGEVSIRTPGGLTPTNTFTHIVGTYDKASGVLNVYVSGILVGSLTNANTSFTTGSAMDVTIGTPSRIGPSGIIDEVRIYNRALSAAEAKALYDYEKVPQPTSPRIATATAQVVNGFVVGATITDGGSGYTNAPNVIFIGGGGSGAAGRSSIDSNGVVTSITIISTGSGYTSTPIVAIASPPFPPRKARATAMLVNGFAASASLTDPGYGYDSPPTVLIIGGGGSGATATATVANGVVTAINITNPGSGFTSTPSIIISSPPFTPSLNIRIARVEVAMTVVLGRKYQLEYSADLETWTAAGSPFVAQREYLLQQFDVDTTGRFFRIKQVP